MKTLIKIDPLKHMHRWYTVGIPATFVDELTRSLFDCIGLPVVAWLEQIHALAGWII